jgi:sugar/nucleoside kinase (ribokinase family)
MGARGAVAVRDGERFLVPALEVKVVDTVGAGDSFNAGFLYQYLRGGDLETCLWYGNLAGAYSTTACGGIEAFSDRAALREFLAAHRPRAEKSA